jgi:hypothetical protein
VSVKQFGAIGAGRISAHFGAHFRSHFGARFGAFRRKGHIMAHFGAFINEKRQCVRKHISGVDQKYHLFCIA